MRRIIKILKISGITAGVFISCLFIVSLLFEEGISQIILKEINKKLNTKVEVRTIKFSLIKMFPQASIELKDINIYSSSSFSRNDLPAVNTDTLLSAERLILSIKLTSLIKKNYIIDKIVLDKASVSVYSDSLRNSNIKIWPEAMNNDTSSLRMELNNVKINDTHFKFISSNSGLCLNLFVGSANNKLILGDNTTEIDINALIMSDSLYLGKDYILATRFSSKVNVRLNIYSDSIVFQESDIIIDEESLSLSGVIKTTVPGLNLNILGDGVNLAGLVSFLPEGIYSTIEKNELSGEVKFNCNISGRLRNPKGPSLDAGIQFNQASVILKEKNLVITEIAGNAVMMADLKDFKKTFSLDVRSISGKAGQAPFYGSLLLTGLESPYIDLIINGDLISEDLIRLADIKGLKRAEGIIRTNIRLSGKLTTLKNPSREDILKLKRSVNLNFRSVNVEVDSFPSTIENIKGNIMLADNAWIDGLSCSVGGQNIVLNGMINGFGNWILDNSSPLVITAGLWSDRIDAGSLLESFSGKGPFSKDDDKESGQQNLKMNFSINCDSLITGNLRASLFTGNIAYSPGLLNIKTFGMMSLGGTLSGNATIIRASGGRHLARGWFDIEDIDIKTTFEIFRDFKQDHIKSENLDGSLTGVLSVRTEIKEDLTPDLSTLIVTGNYSITEGELINFEPVMKLSRFIELTELENIHFSKLENDLLIKDGRIIIPRMDIKSSAFDISASGEHGFSGDYNYHIKVLLSDFLSGKARSENMQVSEFGVIEDDGLGRTSLFLKINGDRNQSNVSYDMEALRGNIRKDLQEEKQTLKSILNEEYGWYQNDTLPDLNQEEKRKFRIIWEEADSINTVDERIKETNRPLFKFFKKKKKGVGGNVEPNLN